MHFRRLDLCNQGYLGECAYCDSMLEEGQAVMFSILRSSNDPLLTEMRNLTYEMFNSTKVPLY